MNTRYLFTTVFIILGLLFSSQISGAAELQLSRKAYQDRVHAIWAGQMIGMLVAFPFEHRVGSVINVDDFYVHTKWKPYRTNTGKVDDDWYYEIVALRGFEKYGIAMNVEQLGRQWLADSAGSWGSSAEARQLLLAGVKPPLTGHPRYNKLWYTIGPQFSADIYGAICPGMPNTAGEIARKLGHINGYAEGADGAVFIAGMVSIAFTEKDCRKVVRKAATLIDSSSPYRKCLDTIIHMADNGASFEEVTDAISSRWHDEYHRTNNAVANGGFVAAGLLYGEGDLMKTANLISRAADFTDSDCNAANAASVIGAIHGTRCLPAKLLARFKDRIEGRKMGPVTFDPPVSERITDLAHRTAAVGEKFVLKHGGRIESGEIVISTQQPKTQLPERFQLADLMQYWNPKWTLHGAGFGFRSVRGKTYLQNNVLATYPRDEVRGLSLRRKVKLSSTPELSFEAGVDTGKSWVLNVWVDNRRILEKRLEGHLPDRKWTKMQVDLSPYANQEVQLRIYQFVISRDGQGVPGGAYWKNLSLK